MEFIQYCRVLAILLLLPLTSLTAQTIYYPADASNMLKNTAMDMAALLRSAMPAANVNTQFYTSLPASGIILQYDSSITDNQACYTSGNGTNNLVFRAAEDNGLVFGVYQYLKELGFLFYQPGSIWNLVPNLSTPFRPITTTYVGRFKYQSWFISGGHRLWIMDKNTTYNWEASYIGENGHEWSLFMRRNGMLGKYRFAGHRGDIMTNEYISTLQNNPCYVASNFGSRAADPSSVPDIFNSNAKLLWAESIEKKYAQNRNTIFNNPSVYKDLVRSFRYNNEYISIEVPDGPRWGFGADSMGCNGQPYPSASDQAAILSNFTSQLIQSKHAGKKTQMYAYFTHADIPAQNLSNAIDVQVPSAFQSETSIKNLFVRWYRFHPNVSEYHYLNIPAWTGETPGFDWELFRQAAERMKQKNGQGIVIEASPAKFSSIPLLRANNNSLLYNTVAQEELKKFCDDMFGQAAAPACDLLKFIGTEQEFLGFKKDNKYRLPLLFDKLQRIQQAAAGEPGIVQQRVAELKAYLHYVALYYDYAFDEKATRSQSSQKGGALCIYLAKCNKLRIVNSYYLINRLVSDQKSDSSFVSRYNSQTGTAYLQGSLPLITANEIEQDYQQDIAKYLPVITQYKFDSLANIVGRIDAGALVPAKKIFVKLGYTLGAQYPGRKQYNFRATAAGKISLSYVANFEMPDYGQVNFVVDETGSSSNIIFDSSIHAGNTSGKIEINIPAAGYYQLIVSTKYQASLDLEIGTGGFAFYKDGPFLGDVRENFSTRPASFPGVFFIPQGLQRLYFSLSNSYSAGKGYLTVDELGKYFIFKNNHGKTVLPKQAATDSLLFYLDIPAGESGSFWQFVNMANRFSLCFANISNYYWFGKVKDCLSADFDIDIIRKGAECIIRARAKNFNGINEWQVLDKNKLTIYTNKKELMLPLSTSPYAVITHRYADNCSMQRSLADQPDYSSMLEACASGASLPIQNEGTSVVAFPNPTQNSIQFKKDNQLIIAEQVDLFDIYGRKLLSSASTARVSLAFLPAATYFYRLQKDGEQYTGKIQKH